MDLKISKKFQLPDTQYFKTIEYKDLIVLHHTVGGTVESTFRWWQQPRERVGTAYVIEKNGVVYEFFDPQYWAFHTGVKGECNNLNKFEKRSIGIELVSEGGLIEYKGKYYCFDRISKYSRFKGKVFDNEIAWREQYRYFSAYTEEQIESLSLLLNRLFESFYIPRFTLSDYFSFNPDAGLFTGVLGHHQIRKDKTDLQPGFPWEKIINDCNLQLI